MTDIYDCIINFHFIRPFWLLALFLLIPLFLFVKRHIGAGGAWSKVCDEELLSHLLVQGNGKVSVWITRALIASFVLSVLALAGPTCKQLEQVTDRAGTNTVFVLDAGVAMMAQDMSPSRLERAKFAIYDILERIKGDQTSLILFDNEGYIVSPLSEDANVIRNILPTVSAEVMPGNGAGDVGKGIAEAVKLLDNAGLGVGRIIVLTGADMASATSGMKEAEKAAAKGNVVSVIAFGSEAGAPAPKERGGFYTDSLGKTIIFKTDNDTLSKLANIGKGSFINTANTAANIDDVLISPMDIFTDSGEKSVMKADEWSDMGVYIVLLIVPLAALTFKKGFIAVFLLSLAIPSFAVASSASSPSTSPTVSSATASTSLWDDLWFNKSQQAVRHMQQKDYGTAASLYSSNAHKGYASYRAENYADAVKALANEQDETSLYNLGNSLAYAGDIEGAIKAYEKAIKINADNQDAIFNRDYLLRQQQQSQSQQNQGNSDKQENNSSQDQQSSNNSDEQNKDNQNNSDTSQGSDDSEDNSKDNDSAGQNSKNDSNLQNQEEPKQGSETSDEQERKNNDRKEQRDNSGGGASDMDEDASGSSQRNPQWMNQINEDKSMLLRARLNKMYQMKQGQ